MASIQPTEQQPAPWIIVPENDIISIEHPCIVKNKIRAIEMLGGAQQLAQNLEQGIQQSLSLNFKPDDPASRSILSLHNETTNVLLKVTVPKRTGRKRKRGTDEHFVETIEDTSVGQDAARLVAVLREIPQKCNVEAVGNIKSCHVWRSIPDFTYYTKASTFLRSIETNLLPQQYPRLKQWSLPQTYGLGDTEIIPPPVFSGQSLSHNYTYRQNPAVKAFADPVTGSKVLFNKAAPTKLHIQTMMFDDSQYPVSPAPDCPPLQDQIEPVQQLVQQLHGLFESRPIWTRRALVNSLPPESSAQLIRIALAYVCFSLRSGPWRDAYVKFGVDPRIHPQYRKYQTILLKLLPRERDFGQTKGEVQRLWIRSPDTKSHIFTGTTPVGPDGKTWQLCDLEDSLLKDLVDIPELYLRPMCEIRYFGWYSNGTSAKMRVLLKAKIDALTERRELDSNMVESFLQLPDDWMPKAKPSGQPSPKSGYLPDTSNTKALEWASAYRNICRTIPGDLPSWGGNGKGRLNKPKPTARPSYIDPNLASEGVADGIAEEVDVDAEVAADYEEPENDDEDMVGVNADDMDI